MNKKILIAIGVVLLVAALIIGIYISQSKTPPMEPSDLMLPESPAATDILPDNTSSEVEQQPTEPTDAPAAPAPLLEEQYEQAMSESDLSPDEIEAIRALVGDGKTFEEALQSVRPGARVVEQGETETSSGNQNTEKPSNNNNGNNSKPTTPTKPPKQDNTTPKTNEGDSGGADFNNPDTRTPEQKEADANDPFSGGVTGGKSGDTSHAPDF